MTFNFFTTKRVSCVGQYDRIDDFVALPTYSTATPNNQPTQLIEMAGLEIIRRALSKELAHVTSEMSSVFMRFQTAKRQGYHRNPSVSSDSREQRDGEDVLTRGSPARSRYLNLASFRAPRKRGRNIVATSRGSCYLGFKVLLEIEAQTSSLHAH
jgi:hypothetical protein